MLWYYVAVAIVVVLALAFYSRRRLSRRAGETLIEASAEIGAPPEVIDRERALLSDRLAGVSRPLVPPPHEGEGSLRSRPFRKDALSKEVELDWEASELIEHQPGAHAFPKDFRDGPSQGEREGYVLPTSYGKDRLVLMARDPRWMYAYWEVARERRQEMYERHVAEWSLSRPVLRFYDLTESSPSRRQFDVPLNDDADNWYIRVGRPDHRFVAELGRVFSGEFVPFIRSNEIAMPRESVSQEISLEWAPLDWESQYGRYVRKRGWSSPHRWGK